MFLPYIFQCIMLKLFSSDCFNFVVLKITDDEEDQEESGLEDNNWEVKLYITYVGYMDNQVNFIVSFCVLFHWSLCCWIWIYIIGVVEVKLLNINGVELKLFL